MTALHLAGNNAPVASEVTLDGLSGEVPAELDGLFVRNGPNPRTGWSAHLYAGDGMLHGVRLRHGRAEWYRNRWVRTPLYESPGTPRRELSVTTANTHVVPWAGRLLALEEGGFPYVVTTDLDTVGPFTFDGALRTAMTAHPKRCPTTGDLYFFGYSLRPPFVTLHRATADGALAWSQEVELPEATMMHDFAITATRIVLFDSPIVFDRTFRAGLPWAWSSEHTARIGIVPRSGGEASWSPVECGHLSHAVNAFDTPDGVVLTGTRLPGDGGLPFLHRWHVDLRSGRVGEESLEDRATEYPRRDDRLVGLPYRYCYTASFVMAAEPDHSTIYKHDLCSGAVQRRDLPPGHTCGEPVFVPRGGGEDEGYLLTFAHDRPAGTSYLLVLDASTMGPAGRIDLPVRVPAGFHGSWIPSD